MVGQGGDRREVMRMPPLLPAQVEHLPTPFQGWATNAMNVDRRDEEIGEDFLEEVPWIPINS